MLSSSDGIKRGHRVPLKLGEDGIAVTHELVTESMSPTVFTVSNFLTEEESDGLRQVMEDKIRGGKLGVSLTSNEHVNGNWGDDEWTPWGHADKNQDGKATFSEIHMAMQHDWDAGGFNYTDLIKLAPEMSDIADPWVKSEAGKELSESEWYMTRGTYNKMTRARQHKARTWLKNIYPEKHSRNSQQMWLPKHPNSRTPLFERGFAAEYPHLVKFIDAVDARVARLLRVKHEVVKRSEDLQMVSYNSTPPGHYRGHHDSGMLEDGLEPMRVYTVFFILNKVLFFCFF